MCIDRYTNHKWVWKDGWLVCSRCETVASEAQMTYMKSNRKIDEMNRLARKFKKRLLGEKLYFEMLRLNSYCEKLGL